METQPHYSNTHWQRNGGMEGMEVFPFSLQNQEMLQWKLRATAAAIPLATVAARELEDLQHSKRAREKK